MKVNLEQGQRKPDWCANPAHWRDACLSFYGPQCDQTGHCYQFAYEPAPEDEEEEEESDDE